MTRRATADSARAARVKSVVVDVVDEENVDQIVQEEYVIRRLKGSDRRALQSGAITDGLLDLEEAGRISVQRCVVDPPLSKEDVDEMDFDACEQLANHIAEFSSMKSIRDAAIPAEEEGLAAGQGFPDADPTPGVGEQVAADRADDGYRMDA